MPGSQLSIDIDHARADQGVVAVHLSGEVDPSTSHSLAGELQALLFTGAPSELILDFKDVGFMDSSGLRVIIDVHNRLRDAGGVLVLEDVSPTIRQVLEISGLSGHLQLR